MCADKRAYSLDALRGYAILTMILSATIAFGVLPGWMYHAQVPPPDHHFDPTVYGITWVDLVFPFFLFAMGAAFPFSIGKKLAKGISRICLLKVALVRGMQLTFFAIYIQHLYPWTLSLPQDSRAWLISLGGFVLLFPMFMRLPIKMPEWGHIAVKAGAFLSGALILVNLPYAGGREFSLGYSNIIILVLANMAVFGSYIYVLTWGRPRLCVAVLPFVMAVFLGSTTEGSWVKALYNYTPVPWMYHFYYLKYLFIVIPGIVAGEYLQEWMRQADSSTDCKRNYVPVCLTVLTFGLIAGNLCGLYARWLLVNLGGTALLLVFGMLLLRKSTGDYERLWKKLFYTGGYLLLLGLFFEAFEGGIRKDHSTYSYYFVTSGLAFMALLFFNILCDYYPCRRALKFLIMAGQNPMIAYVATSLVVMPLLGLLGIASYLEMLDGNAWLGFLKGIVLTALSAGVAVLFTRIRWFWRT